MTLTGILRRLPREGSRLRSGRRTPTVFGRRRTETLTGTNSALGAHRLRHKLLRCTRTRRPLGWVRLLAALRVLAVYRERPARGQEPARLGYDKPRPRTRRAARRPRGGRRAGRVRQ